MSESSSSQIEVVDADTESPAVTSVDVATSTQPEAVEEKKPTYTTLENLSYDELQKFLKEQGQRVQTSQVKLNEKLDKIRESVKDLTLTKMETLDLSLAHISELERFMAVLVTDKDAQIKVLTEKLNTAVDV